MSEHLDDLAEARRYGELVERMKVAAVKAARDDGATWNEIGAVLGISGQGAQSYFARRLKALTAERAS